MTAILEDDDAEVFCKILFECPDKQAQIILSQMMKYLVCSLKIIERDQIEAYVDDESWDLDTMPLCIRFMNVLLDCRHTRAARAWPRFH